MSTKSPTKTELATVLINMNNRRPPELRLSMLWIAGASRLPLSRIEAIYEELADKPFPPAETDALGVGWTTFETIP